jgi:hypothetical protein
MSRTLYLLVSPSPLFPAHWMLFISSKGNEEIGLGINAVGYASSGFDLLFERNYRPADARPPLYPSIPLGQLNDEHVVDADLDGLQSQDSTPGSTIEKIAISVPAPKASLQPVSSVCLFLVDHIYCS